MKPNHWHARQLRITVFCNADTTQAEAWWVSFTGRNPDAIQTKPAAGVTTVTGSGDGRQHILQIGAGRIDWLLNASGEHPPTLGNFVSASDAYVSNGARWLSSSGLKSSRLAFAASLQVSAPDASTAAAILAPQIKDVRVDAEDPPLDLIYQVNRRTISRAVPGLRVNRVAKWALSEISEFEIVMPVQGDRPRATVKSTPLVTLDLDVNNVPSGDLLEPNVLAAALVEFRAMAVGISAEGAP